MYKEKHILNHHTAGHTLSRYLDVYELDTVNCSADKTTGYKGDTITITGTPAWNQKTSSYSVTGATLTGNQLDFTGSDVTAQANYETAKTITTQNCSANKVSGFSGDNVTVTSTPEWNQKFSGYGITGSTLTGNDFIINEDNIFVEGKYEIAKNLTLQTDGHGTIAANRMSGFIGDSVTLSNTPNAGFIFNNYNITGATLTGSNFNFVGSDVTAKANFTLTSFVPTGSMGVYYDDDQNTNVVTNLYSSGVGASVVAHIESVYNWPATAKYAAASWHTSSYTLGTTQTGPRVGVATTGSPSPSFSYYDIASDIRNYGPKLVGVIIDDTNHRLSGFIDRSLVMTAGGIPQPRFFNAGFNGWSCIMSGITMRTFDSYGDAYNFVQLWP